MIQDTIGTAASRVAPRMEALSSALDNALQRLKENDETIQAFLDRVFGQAPPQGSNVNPKPEAVASGIAEELDKKAALLRDRLLTQQETLQRLSAIA